MFVYACLYLCVWVFACNCARSPLQELLANSPRPKCMCVCVCTCVRVHVCMCVRVYVHSLFIWRVHVCMRVRVYVHSLFIWHKRDVLLLLSSCPFVCTFAYVCMCMCMCVYVSVWMRVCAYIWTHMYRHCVSIYTDAHVYIYKYIHIYIDITRNASLRIYSKREWLCEMSIYTQRRRKSSFSRPQCIYMYICTYICMGWFRLVGSLKV